MAARTVGDGTMTRPRGFAPWRPRADTLTLLDQVSAALAEDVAAFARGLGGAEPQFTRLAVTPAQVAALGLPTAPPKPTDRRAFAGATAQAEAIPPDRLSAIVREAIEARQDAAAREWILAREAAERAELVGWAGR